MPHGSKPATTFTVAANKAAREQYNFEDVQDFTDAFRGLVAPIPGDTVLGDDGHVIFDGSLYKQFGVDTLAPDTANPSLWRQSQLISAPGLYKVTDHLYQVRNTDMGNLTIVEGTDGLIIVDCTTGVESAAQGLALFRKHVADKPVAAVILTHTHVDHYGGIKGVVDEADVKSGKVPVIAPGTIASFNKFALGENVVAGNAMSRRAQYAFGMTLGTDPEDFLTCGIAIGDAHNITISYIEPTDPITKTGETRKIAGLTFEFLYAPDTEAPEEMHIWIPELKALTCAENANHSLHNIQTLRGARTRDARNFARFLDETLVRWGDLAEVHYGPHTWPVWGNENVVEFIASQRDTYKYIHDQALRLANEGYTPLEAAEVVALPDELGRKWFNRGYHGTLHHDVRAVFTKELGMWDGDPVSLHPHTPVDTAKKYVAMIGVDALITEGQRAFDEGDYRWAVQVLHNVTFAEPDNMQARNISADAYEQMAYQIEGPQWRGIFLTAAKELREGITAEPFSSSSSDTILAMPIDILFDFAAVHIDGPKAAEANVRLDFEFTDLNETWTMWVARGVLNARKGASADAAATVTGPKAALTKVLLAPSAAGKIAESGAIKIAGDAGALDAYAALLVDFDPLFPMMTP